MEVSGCLSNEKKLQRLKCSIKNYDWGKVGSDSVVAGLYSANSEVRIDPVKPYAEFWMGTHESGHSFVVQRGENLEKKCESESSSAVKNDEILDNGECDDSQSVTLKSWIEKNPAVLGSGVLQNWGPDLPFLFKVLSIAKPLSIQAHPDKELARKLHESQPDVYKDGNHKPEMALAITEFEALCGFIKIKELKDLLQNVPEIRECVGDLYVDRVLNLDDQCGEEDKIKAEVKSLFTELMSASKDTVAGVLSKLKSSLQMKDELSFREQLLLRLESQYPDDVGVLASLFMNYVKLKPGQAMCLCANEPHAYVSGDCIECMATSDNVVRAGLTPKKRDIQTLCSMLTYNLGYPGILEGRSVNKYMRKYCPPFEEFEVDHSNLPKGNQLHFLRSRPFDIFDHKRRRKDANHFLERRCSCGRCVICPGQHGNQHNNRFPVGDLSSRSEWRILQNGPSQCGEKDGSVCLSGCKGPVVCPKPRRFGILASNSTMLLRWQKRTPQPVPHDSKAGAELLDMILMKEGYGEEKSPREVASSPPFFCGSPPIRVSNPLVQDAQFGNEKLTHLLTMQITSPPSISPSSPSSSSSDHKAGCARVKFGLKPAAIRKEGFDCLSRDHQNSSITAVA
ncbi:hypothetical protein Nepgr_020866 [Nepenthes gracilis]|uniref:mannose-6-phosphate isomerase n=1 Tax=Nepenthes gracilis TaxID=150966 RepID=A0AAD3SW34_NEPGR|nr:hypothetical protein Nepgr_020866 [Nepenthes gracilis]